MDSKYTYEPYPPVVTTKSHHLTNNTNSLKRDPKKSSTTSANSKTTATATTTTTACQCFGGPSKRSKTKVFLTSLATNLGICFLLFGYTLIGSIVFLAIEGNNSISHQILATTSMNLNTGANTNVPSSSSSSSSTTSSSSSSSSASGSYKRGINGTEFKLRAEAVRAKTVENIWDITVSLNILYRDNWTRLAAQEITRFQDELLKTITEESELHLVAVDREVDRSGVGNAGDFEWTFSKSFLYSLTVLTTIGYGSIAPKTTLGKAVTMGYAILGIPLTLLYLSSVGSILSRIARGVFSRALCCCLCSNCGYCCYDERRMAEKERRMKKKRQQLELQQLALQQEPFYVRSNSAGTFSNSVVHSPIKDDLIDTGSCTTDNESKTSMQGLSILAPVMLCLAMMFLYICLGTFALFKLENWSLLDGFYFCFMSLTTIGFGNMLPGTHYHSHSTSPNHPNPPAKPTGQESNLTIWFCSLYIMSGMALTAMCFNVVHDEIIHRLKHATAAAMLTGGGGTRSSRGTTGGCGGIGHHVHGNAGGGKLGSVSYPDDLNGSDPYNLTS